MIKDHICPCGAPFKGGPRATYCPECRAVRMRETNRLHKHNGPRRPLGSTGTCETCGKGYVVNAGLQRYCPDCAPESIKAKDRAQGLEYYYKNKDAINPVRNVARRKASGICPECGKAYDPAAGRVTCSAECLRQRKLRQNRECYRRKNRQKEG